ncbi:hypothetical protein [Ruegeria hyattellae]|uniref:hypothetical protein n=1 Tax=Ruegeria hyattellae TaxID=3233337 RepID=UPI00355B010C
MDSDGFAENGPSRQVCSLDGHAHLHSDFPIAQMLDSACRNMGLAGFVVHLRAVQIRKRLI